MKRQDILILLWLCIHDNKPSQKELADTLHISRAAVSYAVERCDDLGLLSKKKLQVRKKSFIEFIIYGLPYIYPAKVSSIVKGIPTSISAAPLNNIFTPNIDYVWQQKDATHMGISVEPLYPSIPDIVTHDMLLYHALALIDAIRIGHTREKKEAIVLLKKLINE